jgi:hypothetical protein
MHGGEGVSIAEIATLAGAARAMIDARLHRLPAGTDCDFWTIVAKLYPQELKEPASTANADASNSGPEAMAETA